MPAHPITVNLLPSARTAIVIPELELSCESVSGCVYEIPEGAVVTFEAKALSAKDRKFLSWSGSLDLLSTYPYPYFQWDTKAQPSELSGINEVRIQSHFEDASFLSTDDPSFPVAFWSVPDWSDDAMGNGISACSDFSGAFTAQQLESDPALRGHLPVDRRWLDWYNYWAVDMTADGLKDLVLFIKCGPLNFDRSTGADQSIFIVVFEQQQDGGFIEITEGLFGGSTVNLGDLSGGIRITHQGDMNGDGFPELVLWNTRDAGTDGAAAENWRSHFDIDDPYPPQGINWQTIQNVLISRADGTYSVQEIAQNAESIFLVTQGSRGEWYILQSEQCGEPVPVEDAPKALRLDGSTFEDVSSQVYLQRFFDDGTSDFCFTTEFSQYAFNMTVDTMDILDPDSINPRGASADLIVGTRPGGLWYPDLPFIGVYQWQDSTDLDESERNCRPGLIECVGFNMVGELQEGSEFSGFIAPDGTHGMTLHGNSYVDLLPESTFKLAMSPESDPIFITMVQAVPLSEGLSIDQVSEDEFTKFRTESEEELCSSEDRPTFIFGVTNGSSYNDCIVALDKKHVVPLVSSMNSDYDLSVLPLSENPFYDPARGWLFQTGTRDDLPYSTITESVPFSEQIFLQASGDNYIDFAFWKVIAYLDVQYPNGDIYCPEAHRLGDDWGVDKTQCNWTVIMINDRKGGLRRVDLNAGDIPLSRGTSSQAYFDLNGDGLMDIVDIEGFSHKHPLNADVLLGTSEMIVNVYYGREKTGPATRFQQLIRALNR